MSHLLKHALTRNHENVDLSNMKIIDSNFHSNKLKGKISEARYITQYRPYLNLLKHLGNCIKFCHFTVILVFRFYSEGGLCNVRSKY